MTREEIIRKYTDREDLPDEVKIEILEDISDMEVPAPEADLEELQELNSRIEELENSYSELKEKYIRRFSEAKEDDPEEEEEEEEEEKIVDVKEI